MTETGPGSGRDETAASEAAVRAWFDKGGWKRDPADLRVALQEQGADEELVCMLIDEGADRRRAHAEQARREAPLAYTPAEHVLGALLLAGALGPEMSRSALDRARGEGLESGMFARERDQLIYQAVCGVVDRDEPAEWMLVERELERGHSLEKAGGALYVRELAKMAPAVENIGSYAHLVVDEAHRRDLERIGLQVVEGARNGGVSDDLRALLVRLVEHDPQQPRDRFVPSGDFVYEESPSGTTVWGVSDDEIAWAAGEGLMIAGPQGVGKTTLMQQLALARIGFRSAVLGMPVAEDTRKVLYVAADRPRQVQRSLARMVSPEDRDLLNERMVVHRGPPLPLITTDPNSLARLADKAGAGTVIVDSLKDVAAKLADDDYGGRINLAFQTLIAAGVELVVGHHQRKASTDNKKPNKLDDVYGSTWITSGLGSVLLLWGEPGDAIVELNHLKQPREQLGPWNIQHDHLRGVTQLAARPDLVDLCFRAATAGLTATAAAGLLFEKDAPTRNEVEKTRRKLERLVDSEKLVKIAGRAGGSGGGAADPARYFYNGGTQDVLA